VHLYLHALQIKQCCIASCLSEHKESLADFKCTLSLQHCACISYAGVILGWWIVFEWGRQVVGFGLFFGGGRIVAASEMLRPSVEACSASRRDAPCLQKVV